MTATLSRIEYSTDPEEAGRSCDLVVEAIVENIAVKQKLFAQLDKTCPRWACAYKAKTKSGAGHFPCKSYIGLL